MDAIKNVGMSLPSVDIMRFAERSGAHMTESQRMQAAAQARAAVLFETRWRRERCEASGRGGVLDFAASSSAKAYQMLQDQRSTVRPSSLLEIRERRRSHTETLRPEQSEQVSRLMSELSVGDDDAVPDVTSSSAEKVADKIDNDLIVVNAADVDDLPPCPEGADCGPVVNLNKMKREKLEKDSVVVAKSKLSSFRKKRRIHPVKMIVIRVLWSQERKQSLWLKNHPVKTVRSRVRQERTVTAQPVSVRRKLHALTSFRTVMRKVWIVVVRVLVCVVK